MPKAATRPAGRARTRSGSAGHAPAKGGEHPITGPCIVVGYDGSTEARHAATWAARRAAPNGRIVLVVASKPRHRWLPTEVARTAAERRKRGHALVEELLMDAEDALLDIRVDAHVVDAQPAEALLDAAREHQASEIVVGSHHHTRADAIYGDVTAGLVKVAPVPVCVVPLADETEPAAEATARDDGE
jgi:nucleotide-binding universal stress UspA family protein